MLNQIDPVSFKFYQLLFAEIIGAILALLGIFLLIRGIQGRTTVIVEGKDIKAKLINASPGIMVRLIGSGIIYYSLAKSSVEITEEGVTINQEEVLNNWLNQSYIVTGNESFPELMNKIVGDDSANRVKVENRILTQDLTLGKIAEEEYNDDKFWRLIAAINSDKPYLPLQSANQNTVVKARNLVALWKVSKYYGKSYKSVIEVSAIDREKGYEQLLTLAESKAKFGQDITFEKLSDLFKQQELGLFLTPAQYDDVQTLGELSLKYFRKKKYWKIIKWANPNELAADVNENTVLDKTKRLWIIHFPSP